MRGKPALNRPNHLLLLLRGLFGQAKQFSKALQAGVDTFNGLGLDPEDGLIRQGMAIRIF